LPYLFGTDAGDSLPFALLTLAPDAATTMRWTGYVGTALAFFLVGAGAHTTQTAGLALASDIAPEHARPRVVAMMYLTLLIGTVVSAFVLGRLLQHYSPIHLIQVIQGAAVLTMALNTICLWKQEARQRGIMPKHERRPAVPRRVANRGGRAVRLSHVGLGFAFPADTARPYGGEIHLTGQTTARPASWPWAPSWPSGWRRRRSRMAETPCNSPGGAAGVSASAA
jgi:BCD family chlorophyll transporter-like MFS transporter